MKRSLRVLAIALILAGAGLPVSRAQLPLGNGFQVNQKTEFTQAEQLVAAAADGSFVVTFVDGWDRGEVFREPVLAIRFYDPTGAPLSDVGYPEGDPLESPISGPVAQWARKQGGYGILSVRRCERPGNLVPACYLIRNYDVTGKLIGGPPFLMMPVDDEDEPISIRSVRSAPSGRLVLGWVRGEIEAKAASFNARGEKLGPPFFQVAVPKGAALGGFDLDLDAQGNTVAAWGEDCGPRAGDHPTCDVFAQRFTRLGAPLGDKVTVSAAPRSQWVFGVSTAPAGQTLVAWEATEPIYDGDHRFAVDVEARLISADGKRLGKVLRLGSRRTVPEFFPASAADPFGNFAVAWSSFNFETGSYGWDILGRLVDHDGKAVGRNFRINSRGTFNEFAEPKVAFGGNGTLVVVWNARDDDADGVFGQRFLASPADEPCVLRAGRLLCDGGRSGDLAELDRTLALGAENTFALGDADGDGRKDLCAFSAGSVSRAGEFRCEIDPRDLQGSVKEVRLKFGAAGDVPLFGDVDGDGREEPCVRRGRYHLCDTAHNGGRPEAAFRVGEEGDEPLMGDLDGDGRDDACVFSRGRFLCDLHRAGRKPVAILFGEVGDSPALGDYDGDGDDDPCVLRASHILCDLAHDGGEPEAVLEFGQAGDRLLLGNLDGL